MVVIIATLQTVLTTCLAITLTELNLNIGAFGFVEYVVVFGGRQSRTFMNAVIVATSNLCGRQNDGKYPTLHPKLVYLCYSGSHSCWRTRVVWLVALLSNKFLAFSSATPLLHAETSQMSYRRKVRCGNCGWTGRRAYKSIRPTFAPCPKCGRYNIYFVTPGQNPFGIQRSI